MGLNIRILTGNRKGEEFKLRPGIQIGRKNVDLVINDAKISSLHAEIETRTDKIFIIDKGSRNKIQSAGVTYNELQLVDGVRFRLGDTDFEIIFDTESDTPKAKALDLLKQMDGKVKNKPLAVQALPFKLIMHVKSGPDKGLSLPFGYAPRSIGSASEDIELSDCGNHKILFQITRKGDNAYLISKNPDFFLVNAKKAKAENLIENNMEVRFSSTHLVFEIL